MANVIKLGRFILNQTQSKLESEDDSDQTKPKWAFVHTNDVTDVKYEKQVGTEQKAKLPDGTFMGLEEMEKLEKESMEFDQPTKMELSRLCGMSEDIFTHDNFAPKLKLFAFHLKLLSNTFSEIINNFSFTLQGITKSLCILQYCFCSKDVRMVILENKMLFFLKEQTSIKKNEFLDYACNLVILGKAPLVITPPDLFVYIDVFLLPNFTTTKVTIIG